MIPTEYMQDTHRPTTILTDNLLWDYTTFPEYVLTHENFDTSGDKSTEQDGIRYRLETEQPFSQLFVDREQATEGSQIAPIANERQIEENEPNIHEPSTLNGR